MQSTAPLGAIGRVLILDSSKGQLCQSKLRKAHGTKPAGHNRSTLEMT